MNKVAQPTYAALAGIWQRRSNGSLGRPVQLDRNSPGVTKKIGVGGEDLAATSKGDGTDQEVDRGADDAPRTTLITQFSRVLEIFREERLVWKRAKFLPEALELRWLSNSRKQFLPNRPD